ncbi:UDP-glycosyltransferase 74F2-like [Silene latifolia]|uniref:UDP-glycosyltransferase 74F2-like n=1 Tax=Silene latifolia TaxID=37657 RepID=UPI003D782F6A
MSQNNNTSSPHVLALPYPSQGHINPMIQFCRRLSSKGVKVSLALTNFISNTLKPRSDGHVSLVTISDGYDEGGFTEAGSVDTYLDRLKTIGSSSLGQVIEDHVGTSHPITCLVYDAFLPWALDIARVKGVCGAAFFTQACLVNYVYYLVYHKRLDLPIVKTPVEIRGLPLLEMRDLPSFVDSLGSYPGYLKLVLEQNCNLDKADFVLVNTCYELEKEVTDAMSKECPLLTIGPTVPSFYLDKRIDFDKDYGLNLYHIDANHTTACITWLNSKPPRSVVYVSFGSMACLPVEQMEELALGLKQSAFDFLWVVRQCEMDKLPMGFIDEVVNKGLIVTWTEQLEVLANESIGCFFTHCGWNSTLEALALGVPMVGMPQWTDQPTDAKLVEDVWKVGVRVKVGENGVVKREEIVKCIIEVMEGDTRLNFAENAKYWKDLARNAVCEDGSSDKNINQFVSKISSS